MKRAEEAHGRLHDLVAKLLSLQDRIRELERQVKTYAETFEEWIASVDRMSPWLWSGV